MSGKIRVGISGWTYAPWRGDFYPKGLVQKKELEYASRQLTSIEINGTFYGLQKPKSFLEWYKQTPDDFMFSIKGGQFITHVRRLKDVMEPLATCLGSGLLCLKQKLGPILWQFPPNVTLKDDRFEKFFEILPHDSKSAAKFADEHGYKKEGGYFVDVTEDFPIRHAFEFRHPSFDNPEFIELMRKHGVAVVIAHAGAEKSPYIEETTARDFVYVRMHGQGKAFKKGYPEDELKAWAKKVKGWAKDGRDVFVYFDTDEKEYAPSDAANFLKQLKIKVPGYTG